MSLFSPNPSKAAVERFWLRYTLVWSSVAGIVMISGLANVWGDIPLFIMGASLGGGAVLGAIYFRSPEDRSTKWHQSTAAKFSGSVILFSFLLNYSQTPFFWDVLHMHYGFQTEWNIQNNPIFLYLLTIAYFATYAVLLNMAFRFAKQKLQDAPKAARLSAYLVVPFVVAALETALNANPFTTGVFCYDEPLFMLTFGTLAYGDAFVFALPVWIGLDEESDQKTPWLQVVVWSLAAIYAHLLVLDFLRYNVAPYFTVVEEGANGLRDFGESCLAVLQ